MRNITNQEFIILIDALKAKGILPLGSGDIIADNDNNNEMTEKILSTKITLFNLYCLFNWYVPLSINTICDAKFKEHQLLYLALFYVGYVKAYEKEPFNLAQELYDNVKVGGEYFSVFFGGGNMHRIILSKKIDNNNLQFTYTYIKDDGLLCSDNYVKKFNFDSKNLNIFNDVYDYKMFLGQFVQGSKRNKKQKTEFTIKNLLKHRRKEINDLIKQCKQSLKKLNEIEENNI